MRAPVIACFLAFACHSSTLRPATTLETTATSPAENTSESLSTASDHTFGVTECLRLTFGNDLGQDVEPFKDRVDTDEEGARSTESAQAEVLVLTGHPATPICIAWHSEEICVCHEDPGCHAEDEEECSTETNFAVALIKRHRGSWTATDDLTYMGTGYSHGGGETEGMLSWRTVKIGPSLDALLLTETDESGDTHLARTKWVTIEEDVLTKHFEYESGTEGGTERARVEYEILPDQKDGHFSIRFSEAHADESAGKDIDSVEPETRVCTWDTAGLTYECEEEG